MQTADDVKLQRMNLSPDPQFSDSADRADREAWVDMRLARTFMQYALASLNLSVLVMVVIVALLYDSVDRLALGIWTLAAVGVTALRYAAIFSFRRKLDGVSGPLLNAFMVRWGWAWPAAGIIWGASMFVFF